MCWPSPNQTATRSSFAPTWTQTGEGSEESKVSTVIRQRVHLPFKKKECVCIVVPSAFQSFWTTKRRSRLLAAVMTRSPCCPAAATLSLWSHLVLTFLGKHQQCPSNSDRCQIFWNNDTSTIDIARSHRHMISVLTGVLFCQAAECFELQTSFPGCLWEPAFSRPDQRYGKDLRGKQVDTMDIFFVVLWAGNNYKTCVCII